MDIKKVVDNTIKDLPKLIKENKGAAIGAVVGYLLSDKIKNSDLTSAVIGGLVGAFIDEKNND